MAAERPKADEIAAQMGAECLALRARVLSRSISGIFNTVLAPFGLTTGQASILAVLHSQGPVAQREIARQLHLEKSTVSRTVERMREQNWITTSPTGAGNQQDLALTPRGRRLLVRAAPAWRQAQADASALLGRTGTKAVHQAANAVWERDSLD